MIFDDIQIALLETNRDAPDREELERAYSDLLSRAEDDEDDSEEDSVAENEPKDQTSGASPTEELGDADTMPATKLSDVLAAAGEDSLDGAPIDLGDEPTPPSAALAMGEEATDPAGLRAMPDFPDEDVDPLAALPQSISAAGEDPLAGLAQEPDEGEEIKISEPRPPGVVVDGATMDINMAEVDLPDEDADVPLTEAEVDKAIRDALARPFVEPEV